LPSFLKCSGNITYKIWLIKRSKKIIFANVINHLIKLLVKSMKKVSKASLVLALVIVSGILMSSCKSSQVCPSYGEVQKFQREVRR
jgi:ribosomal protein L11 methylase PrmA